MRRRTKPRVHAFEILAARLPLAGPELLSPGWTHAANANTTFHGISDDGRYTYFSTSATNLDPTDTDNEEDLYRYDRVTESLDLLPTRINGLGTHFVRMSSDGNSLLFALQRTEVIFGDPVSRTSLLHYDVPSGEVSSVTPTLEYDVLDIKDEISYDMTDDGGTVVFTTKARNIVAADTNQKADVFLWRKADRSYRLVSVPFTADTMSNGDSADAFVSGDGRYVLFHSKATNLVDAAYLTSQNIFRFDTSDRSTVLISKAPGSNTSLNASSQIAHPGESGQSVFFRTTATNTGAQQATSNYVWQSRLSGFQTLEPEATTALFDRTDSQVAYDTSYRTVQILDLTTLTKEIHDTSGFGNLRHWSLTSDFRYLKLDSSQEISSLRYSSITDRATNTKIPSTFGGLMAREAPVAAIHGIQRPWNLKEVVPEYPNDDMGPLTFTRQTYIQDITSGVTRLASQDKTPDPWPVDTRRPQISNDGRLILYRRVTPTLAVPDQSLSGPILYDRTLRTIRSLNIPGYADLFSPGGRYVVHRTSNPSVTATLPTYWIYDIKNGESFPVATDNRQQPKPVSIDPLFFSDNDGFLFFNARVSEITPQLQGTSTALYRLSLSDRSIQLVSTMVGAAQPGSRGADSAQSSGDGRYVVYETIAPDLYPDDRNQGPDIFLKDMFTGETTLVSRNAFVARTGNGNSTNPRISLDGTRVVFESDANNLIPSDTNNHRDVFVYDVPSRQLSLASVAPDGSQANGDSQGASITSDGRRIAFASSATNLSSSPAETPWRIYYLDLPGTQLKLLPNATYGTSTSLGRSGRIITVFTGKQYVITETQSLSGGRQVVLPLPYSNPFDFAADGTEFAVSGDESTVVYSQVSDVVVPNAYAGHPYQWPGEYRYIYALSLDEQFAQPQAFAPPTTFDSGPESNDVDLADLNRDGHLDAFFTNYTTLGHRIFFGDGQGGFIDSGQRLLGAASFYSALGDLDGDGDIDAYVPTLGSDTIWFNDGRGNFSDSGQRLGNDRSIDVALGDLDGDGDLDAYVANFEAKPDRVWLNQGNGTFVDSGQELGDTWSKGIELGDVDGDGDLDALVANGTNRGGEPNRVWFNDGRARFTDSGQRLGNSQTQHGALGDADGDGDLDAVFANSTNLAEPNELWLNDGKGVFTDSGQRLGKESTSHIAFADFDGDEDLDLFFANWLNQPSDVWFNDGRGNYTRGADRLGLSQGSHVAIGDLNGDGQLDALLANTDNKAELYLNRAEPWDADANPNRVMEMAAPHTPVGITIAAKPPTEPGNTRFSLVDDAGGRFAIDTNTGVVTVKNGSLLDTQQSTRHVILAQADVPGRGSFLRSFSISVVSPYQPLQARADGYSTQDGVELVIPSSTGLLANDTVDPSAVALVTSHDPLTMLGIPVAVEASGAFRYDARQQAVLQALPQGATLEDRFQYAASTNRPESSSATVTITVIGVNDGPIANPDNLGLREDLVATDITATLLENDTDPDTNGKAGLRVQALQSDGLRGKLELRGERVWYEVGQAFNYLMVGQTAEERFQYTIADEHGATSSASVVIVIRGDSNRPTDMNGDDLVDIADLEELCRGIRTLPVNWRYDTNRDGQVNDADVDHYLATTLRTTHGDANLDSTFDSSDLVLAFQSGQYEDSIAANARWSTGDWNCDGEFNSSDLVRAFQSGAYTQNTTIHVKPWPAAECNQADRFCSIQKAVDAAERGDMILVWPGSYAPFTVRKDFLTIKGVDRDGATVVVDGLLGDNPTADGVTLLGDRILLEGLTVRDSINGFRVEGSSNSLLRNVAYDNVVGFRISGNSNFLQRNRAFANRRDGFFLATESAAATMLHNESEANLRNGYWLGGTSDVIGHNRAKANLVGFLLAGRTLSLQNNEATLNQQTGFLLETGGHTLASNTSRSNLLLGFWALQSANRNVYNSNIAEANSGSGFRLDSSLEMLVGNQSTANAAEGFLVTGSSHVMSTNGATANGSHGFLLLQSGTRLYRNQSHKNAGWGFRLQSLGNTLVENTAEGNQLGDIG